MCFLLQLISLHANLFVDSTGERTLDVVTKCDRSPDGLLEKVSTNEVNIGLGYICVRNRINNETYEEARKQEATLFETHPLLSKIDKAMVVIPVLAHRLVQIQSVIISKCLPDIVKKINTKLNASVLELNKLPRNLISIPEAMVAFMQIVGSLKDTLHKILIRGEYDVYENDKQMHCNARLTEMLDKLSKDLQPSVKFSEGFLVDEMHVLEEANAIRLPNLLPHSVFLSLLHIKLNNIYDLPISFGKDVWSYLETVCSRVLIDSCGNYPQLLPSMRKGTQNVMEKMKVKFVKRVVELIEMEKITYYTCDADFIASYNKLMSNCEQFLKSMSSKSDTIKVEGYGTVSIKHLISVSENTRDQAFDLKMRMTAYWKTVLKRMVDSLAETASKQVEIVNEVMVHGGGMAKMLDEPPFVAKKRKRLQSSISLLQESKEIIEQVMDGMVVTSDH